METGMKNLEDDEPLMETGMMNFEDDEPLMETGMMNFEDDEPLMETGMMNLEDDDGPLMETGMMNLEDDDEPLMETVMMNLEEDDEPLMEMGVLGDKRKHVEGEYTSSQAKKPCVTEIWHDIGEGKSGGRQVQKSCPKTLVSPSRIGFKRRLGSQRVGVLGDKGKHVEGEYTSSQAKKPWVTEIWHDIGEGKSGGSQVQKSCPKTLVSPSRLGFKRRLGSQWVADSSFEYEASSDDEIVDPSTGVRRRGVGYLFPTAPKQFMTKLLTGDDMGKLGKTKLDKKVKRMEKFGARFAGYGYGVALNAFRERERRRRAERQVGALRREMDALVADLDLLQEDAEEGFAADKKRLEDQVKEAVNVANKAQLKLTNTKKTSAEMDAKLKYVENSNSELSKKLKEAEEELQKVRTQLGAVPTKEAVIEEYKASPAYKESLEAAVTDYKAGLAYRKELEDFLSDFRSSREFVEAIGAGSRRFMPLVVDCCREFFKDDLSRPRDGFETFFLEWIRARQRAQTRRERSRQS